jgi:hypothetical protein
MRTSKRREEIERLLERRDREGLTYAEVARIAGIRPSTVTTWAWRLRREGRRPARRSGRQSFVEIVPRDCERDGARVEIELRSGRRVIVPAEVGPEQLTRIVRALESC